MVGLSSNGGSKTTLLPLAPLAVISGAGDTQRSFPSSPFFRDSKNSFSPHSSGYIKGYISFFFSPVIRAPLDCDGFLPAFSSWWEIFTLLPFLDRRTNAPLPFFFIASFLVRHCRGVGLGPPFFFPFFLPNMLGVTSFFSAGGQIQEPPFLSPFPIPLRPPTELAIPFFPFSPTIPLTDLRVR